MKKIGFDLQKYLEIQTKRILERVEIFDEKLYLEFGGKLYDDFHAMRVLPGYEPDTKVRMLQKLGDRIEIVYCISAKDLQKGRIRHDFGLTYDNQALRDIGEIRHHGLNVSTIVINRFSGEESALRMKKQLESSGNRVYLFNEIEEYPFDIQKVLAGYEKQPHIDTDKPIIVVTGVGGGSGKMSLCLANLYHETKKKQIKAGFSKFETFPIWNLPVDHPVNVAYEAATADLGDQVLIDSFHLSTYNIQAVNYNRDIENFRIMKSIVENIVQENNPVARFNSPTDMGVNMAGFAIVDDQAVREASKKEVIRRYFKYRRDVILGLEKEETMGRMEQIMQKINAKPEDYELAKIARKAAEEAQKKGKGNKNIFCGAAIELPDGEIVSGKNSSFLHAESAAVLNAIKKLADISDEINLLPESIIHNISMLKKNVFHEHSESLDLEEVMVALSIGAGTNPFAELGVKMLKILENCNMHITHLPNRGDEAGLVNLKLNVTTDALLTLQPHYLK